MADNYVYVESEIFGDDGITAPLSLVLHTHGDEFVTHLKNCNDGGRFSGNYFNKLEDAIDDYICRCIKEDVHVGELNTSDKDRLNEFGKAYMLLCATHMAEGLMRANVL